MATPPIPDFDISLPSSSSLSLNPCHCFSSSVFTVVLVVVVVASPHAFSRLLAPSILLCMLGVLTQFLLVIRSWVVSSGTLPHRRCEASTAALLNPDTTRINVVVIERRVVGVSFREEGSQLLSSIPVGRGEREEASQEVKIQVILPFNVLFGIRSSDSEVGRDSFMSYKKQLGSVPQLSNWTPEVLLVGDDSRLILWDARTGTVPAAKVEKSHETDLHCVDWNLHDENLILTGSADNSVHMFDRRNLTNNGVGLPVHKFEGHEDPVLCVQVFMDVPLQICEAKNRKGLYKLTRAGKIKDHAATKSRRMLNSM